MTATITEERVEQEEELQEDNPIPCHDLSTNGDCDNPADLMTRPRCCNRHIPLCEECFFNFTAWAKKCQDVNPNWKLTCNYCSTVSFLEPNYLVVLWRIR